MYVQILRCSKLKGPRILSIHAGCSAT